MTHKLYPLPFSLLLQIQSKRLSTSICKSHLFWHPCGRITEGYSPVQRLTIPSFDRATKPHSIYQPPSTRILLKRLHSFHIRIFLGIRLRRSSNVTSLVHTVHHASGNTQNGMIYRMTEWRVYRLLQTPTNSIQYYTTIPLLCILGLTPGKPTQTWPLSYASAFL